LDGGKHVYVTSQWRGGAVIAWKRNTATGQLEHVDVITQAAVEGLSSPNGIIISSNGKFVYVAGGGEGAIVAFSRNASTGKLTFLEVYKGATAGSGLGGCFALALSPDQYHLYALGPQ
jgi:6-phosphogluconolactonase (cycloisomerase 2 family)